MHYVYNGVNDQKFDLNLIASLLLKEDICKKINFFIIEWKVSLRDFCNWIFDAFKVFYL